MKITFTKILFFILVTIIFGCNPTENPKRIFSDSSSNNVEAKENTTHKELGERFSIVGDFNGDGITDNIYESYISSLSNKEAYKVPDNQDWYRNIEMIVKQKPVTRIFSNIPNIDTFVVTKEPQQIGLFHFRNLGDLNEDGKDEIGFAINWADYSNLNTYHIVTIVNQRFKEILSFKINEMICFENSEELFDNNDFIKKVDNKTIKFKFYTDSATFEVGQFRFKN